jgi:hypothetical protein
MTAPGCLATRSVMRLATDIAAPLDVTASWWCGGVSVAGRVGRARVWLLAGRRVRRGGGPLAREDGDQPITGDHDTDL